ncbi:MAG TPA: hypothetical protein VN493_18670 [Thermoanaerobaculia bacterium]|nr:hypothetical protein [Thermoanaerobaculia bacterium]
MTITSIRPIWTRGAAGCWRAGAGRRETGTAMGDGTTGDIGGMDAMASRPAAATTAERTEAGAAASSALCAGAGPAGWSMGS